MFQKWYSDYTSDISRTINENLNFILNHFAASPFARTISTKTTQGQQITANNNEEALARFKQANYLDCRINAYSSGDLRDDPNFVFLDIDSTADPKVLDRILNFRLRKIGTVLFTGTGLDIYQPKESVCLNEIEDFSIYQNLEPSNQFLRFAEMYLSDVRSDPSHNPSLKSCMVWIPGCINSKNGQQVQITQEWDGHRPSIALMIGSFQLWLSTRQKKEAAKFAASNGRLG